jgi:hypothetical protein
MTATHRCPRTFTRKPPVRVDPLLWSINPHPTSHCALDRDAGVEMDGSKIETAFFRGRCLKGAQLPLPSGYTGYLVEKQASSTTADDGAAERWAATSTFDQLTYWNHDTVPTSVDPVRRAVDWASLSTQVTQASYPNHLALLSMVGVALEPSHWLGLVEASQRCGVRCVWRLVQRLPRDASLLCGGGRR